MLLLITGASGVGKTTARMVTQKSLGSDVECVEFSTVVAIPAVLDVEWRQRSVETVVQRAVALQA